MITIENPSLDPFFNQAFEEAVFNTVRDEDVFLLWRNRPAVVVGCYQNICREVSAPELLRREIPVVRRMSGGGTVYHDLGNLNYSLILPQTELLDYDRCLEPVLRALHALGVPARKDRTCDIAVDGGKISGSAQRAAGGRLLHHGTLLFDADLRMLDAVTTAHKNECFRSRGTVSAICPVTNLKDHLRSPMTLPEFQEALLRAVVGGGQRRSAPPELLREAERLRDEKYRAWAWTWGRNPAFACDRQERFAGLPIRVAYEAKHGILSGVTLESPVLPADAASALEGARLDPAGLLDICRTLDRERAWELLACIL